MHECHNFQTQKFCRYDNEIIFWNKWLKRIKNEANLDAGQNQGTEDNSLKKCRNEHVVGDKN